MTDAAPREEANSTAVTPKQVPRAVENVGHDVHSLVERLPLCEV